MLPRRKRNSIRVDGRRFHYAVAEITRDRDDYVALAINVQDADTNGERLRVTGLRSTRLPEDQSKFWRGLTLSRNVLPRHVAALIRRATTAGWNPAMSGPVFELEVENPASFDDLVDR